MARREPGGHPHQDGQRGLDRPPSAVRQPALGGWPGVVRSSARWVQLGDDGPGPSSLGARACVCGRRRLEGGK
eukprot:11872046-Alexandrium_andersonii.AAC.1